MNMHKLYYALFCCAYTKVHNICIILAMNYKYTFPSNLIIVIPQGMLQSFSGQQSTNVSRYVAAWQPHPIRMHAFKTNRCELSSCQSWESPFMNSMQIQPYPVQECMKRSIKLSNQIENNKAKQKFPMPPVMTKLASWQFPVFHDTKLCYIGWYRMRTQLYHICHSYVAYHYTKALPMISCVVLDIVTMGLNGITL